MTGPPACLGFLAAAREPTRRQWWWRVGRPRAATVPAVAEGLPCNFWSFRGYFVNFKLFNVIFV